MGTIPSFIVAGGQRCGTTTLHDLLRHHAGIWLPREKEIHYFENEANFARGAEWYLEHFAGAKAGQMVGEITPDYMVVPVVPARMRALLKDVKVIFLLRDPVKRAYSQHSFHVQKGVERILDFKKALLKDPFELEPEPFRSWHRPALYLARGAYFTHMTRFIDVFGRERVKIYLFEDLLEASSRRELLRNMFTFIGVNPDGYQEPGPVHSNPSKFPRNSVAGRILLALRGNNRALAKLLRKVVPSRLHGAIRSRVLPALERRPEPLSREMHAELMRTYYRDEIHRLEDLLGRDLSLWHNGAL